MGEGDNERANSILGSSTALLIALAVVATAVFQIWKEPLLLAFGATENTIGYASDYLSIYLWGSISVLLALGLNSFVTAQGFSTFAMLTVVIGAAINIALDPLFIFVFDMGVRGAALGHHYRPDCVGGMGGVLPYREEVPAAYPAKIPPSEKRGAGSYRGSGGVPLYHAVYGELSVYLLQFLSADLWRRYRSGRHDHLFFGDAGGLLAASGTGSRRAAHCQL